MTAYADQLDSVVARAASACVSCGACFEACPTAREIGMARDGAVARVGELKALAAGEAAAPELTRWLDACDGSGRCVDACPENINVRQWIAVSRMKAVSAARPEEARRAAQAKRFRSMSQAVRLLGAMQLPSETLSRVLAPVETRHAEVLFYTGCNVLRTPHIVLNVMDILDTLGVDFDVVGGPSHCCGVYQFLEADLPTYERVGHRTFERFGKSGAKQVLTWCPTCTKNFDELEADPAPPSFDLAHISEFLAASLDRLRPAFVDLPPRRAVIHEHQGIGASLESVRALMRAVPNLTVVDFPQDSGFSYACGGVAAKYKDRERAIHAAVAEGARAAGADLVVTMYHSCHRALAGAGASHPFEVVNFTDVLAEAVGKGGRADYYKQYKSGGDMAEAVAAARRFLESNGVRVDARTIGSLTADIFGETGIAAPADDFRRAMTTVAIGGG